MQLTGFLFCFFYVKILIFISVPKLIPSSCLFSSDIPLLKEAWVCVQPPSLSLSSLASTATPKASHQTLTPHLTPTLQNAAVNEIHQLSLCQQIARPWGPQAAWPLWSLAALLTGRTFDRTTPQRDAQMLEFNTFLAGALTISCTHRLTSSWWGFTNYRWMH